MSPILESLTIEHFRSFRELRIVGLGRVNLITGRNNTGKSSVLEALRILGANASPALLQRILRDREEDSADGGASARSSDGGESFQISSLFPGFPQFSDELQPIVIAAGNGPGSLRVAISVGWFSEEVDDAGTRRLVPRQRELFSEGEAFPALIVEAGGARRIRRMDAFRRYPFRDRPLGAELSDDQPFTCVFVSPYGGERTSSLGLLWDNIALSDREKDVVAALQIINSSISAVSMVGGEGPRQERRAIVRASDLSRPVPLRSFGDGLNRLFGIVLSLVNAKDGVLLIDEFENGMHHTVQEDAWRAIFRLARELDIQVFASSHSWDAIEAFQKAAVADPDSGVLIRLSRKGDQIVATRFSEQELIVATRDGIEVR